MFVCVRGRKGGGRGDRDGRWGPGGCHCGKFPSSQKVFFQDPKDPNDPETPSNSLAPGFLLGQ